MVPGKGEWDARAEHQEQTFHWVRDCSGGARYPEYAPPFIGRKRTKLKGGINANMLLKVVPTDGHARDG